jgi:hypothetical protein
LALNVSYEHIYNERPEVEIRLEYQGRSSVAIALLDTGADITLFDADVAKALDLDPSMAAARFRIAGIGPTDVTALCWRVRLSVLGAAPSLSAELTVGFVPRLGDRTGNLLGRDFMEHVDIGLSHADRTLYLGAHAG